LPEYQAPNQETPTGKLIIAFLVMIVFLTLYQPLMKKYGAKYQAPEQTAPQAQPQTPSQTPTAQAEQMTATAAPKKGAAAAVPTKQAGSESETVIENDLYKITFSNRGGRVKSWVLKKFDDDKGQPQDLVHRVAAEQYGYPLSLWTYDENLRKKLNSVLYVSNESGQLSAPTDITFEYADGELNVRKSFHFDHSYEVKVDVEVTQNGQTVQAFLAWPAGFGDQQTPTAYAVAQVHYRPLNPGKKWWGGTKDAEHLPLKNLSNGATIREPFYWGGASDQYFAAIFLPNDPLNAALVTLHDVIQVPKNPEKPNPNETNRLDVVGAAVGNVTGHTSLRLFAGPKNMDVLDSVHASVAAGQGQAPDLRSLVDLGTFGFIARPLFLALRWTHGHLAHNWGWAIVILTIIINVALLPLRLTSMKSALKTAKIQPLMNSIRDKYKKYDMRDPRRQQMNQEIAALMKEHGVNPAGGCLPLLIQFPFLIAFYTMLGSTLELRHATWFYIKDLSSSDPYHILPLLIIVTTFIVQRMTPQGGMDPQQQKIMNLMMPVMLGVISWNLSSGLCLYWVVGNVVAMLLQVAMNRTGLGQEMRDLAAKRARKQALKA
jgi:YidC/Oxa1 family membrane protein insertase